MVGCAQASDGTDDAAGAVIARLLVGELLPFAPPVSKPEDQRAKVLSH